MSRRLIPLLLILIGSPSLLAERATFDAASIRRNVAGGTSAIRVLPGGLSVTNDPVGDLIHTAYDVENFQVVDGPEWVVRERWDIVATAGHAATPAEVHAMLRSLLEDRFHLVAHTAMRQMRVYTLVHARADGRLGRTTLPPSRDRDGGTSRPAHPI